MKLKSVDVNSFRSIDDAYKAMEENCDQLERDWEMAGFWIRYREIATLDEEKQKAQWEVESFNFEFKGGKLFNYSYSNGKDPKEIITYPDLNQYSSEAFAYLKKRSVESKNPILKTRYNHLLWKAPVGVKHNEYAVEAINNYILSIRHHYYLYLKTNDMECTFQIGKYFENLLNLSKEVKHGFDEIKDLAKFLLFKSSLAFHCKHGIVNDMLDHPKAFKETEFNGVLEIYENFIAQDNKLSEDFSTVRYYLPTALRVAQKTHVDVKRWHNEMGLIYLRIADREIDQERFWLKLDDYTRAINAFTLAGNSEKVLETEQLYADLKPRVRLNNVEIPFSAEASKAIIEFQDFSREVADDLLKLSPEAIYRAVGQGFNFPKHVDMLKSSKGVENSFLNDISGIYFDINKNISEKSDFDSLFNSFSYYANIGLMPYLERIFVQGIKSGVLTIENFMDYLVNKTWIGTPFISQDLGGDETVTHWTQLIAPAIVEYFVQVQGWTSSKYYKPSYILCIDSLTIKMEGLLRNFCERLKIPTSAARKKGMQEKYIHDLLHSESIKKYFNEDDLLFLNYLFSDGGMNLRNNVAHSFYSVEDYNHGKILLLLAALLRIGKFQMSIKKG